MYDAAEDRAYSAQVQGGVVTHQRWYMGDYERDEVAGAAAQQIHYISGDAGLSAIVVEEGGSFTYYAAYTDHLGSIVLLTDDAGTPLYRQAYDPWGRERDPETWNYGVAGAGTKPGWLTRGYTGHEMLPEYGLVNMNGRMYDPLNGRMLRPDNYVQDPTNTQNYNRFSYCLNNPMKYTDPSGDQYNTSNYSYGYTASYGASGSYYGVPYSLSYSASFSTYNTSYLNTYNNGLFIQTYSTNIWGFNSSQTFSASYGNMSASWSVNFSSKIETTALVETKVNPYRLEGFRLNFDYLKNNIETISKSVTQNNTISGSMLDPKTLNRNWFSSSYIGPYNPKDYKGKDNYDYIPKSLGEYPAISHDKSYEKVGAYGITGVLFDTRTINADLQLFVESFGMFSSPYFDLKTRYQTFGSSLLIIPTLPKIILYNSLPPYHPIKIIGISK
ncbi:MAG: hypothetical protein JNL13_08550 [Chitinophagaceae bacterium]|nr:hypothetical protein [Chitinophagaceae bacterium]